MHKVVIGYGKVDHISCCYKYYFKLEYANGSFNSMCTTKHTSPIRQMCVPTQGEKKDHWMVGVRHL